LRALRALCDEHGIVLIADEVQSGFARTGKMFAMEHSGVRPDLVTVAKSLAGGFPLSGVIGRKALMDAVAPGALGGTYAGSPVACAAALAVLDVIEEEGLVERADVIGATIKGAIEDVSQQNDAVGISSVRGRGAMIAFDIVKHRGTSPLADPDTTKKVTRAALSAGLVLLSCGVHGNTIRLLNPLTISDDVLAEGLRLLAGALIVGGNESA
jgi:4-aminobutyrate aminotransferase/(S)-3-amino-2-methylpropionate transaminase